MAALHLRGLRSLRRLRVVGVLGTCLVMTPVWMILTPVGWTTLFGDENGHNVFGAVFTLAGSLAAGALFLLLTRLRGRPPSLWFSLAVPAVGVTTVGILASLLDPPTFVNGGLALFLAFGFVWLYVYAALFTLPAAIAHTALMGLFVESTAPEASDTLE